MSTEDTVRAMIAHALASAPKVAPVTGPNGMAPPPQHPNCRCTTPLNALSFTPRPDLKETHISMILNGVAVGWVSFDQAQFDNLMEIMRRNRPES